MFSLLINNLGCNQKWLDKKNVPIYPCIQSKFDNSKRKGPQDREFELSRIIKTYISKCPRAVALS